MLSQQIDGAQLRPVSDLELEIGDAVPLILTPPSSSSRPSSRSVSARLWLLAPVWTSVAVRE